MVTEPAFMIVHMERTAGISIWFTHSCASILELFNGSKLEYIAHKNMHIRKTMQKKACMPSTAVKEKHGLIYNLHWSYRWFELCTCIQLREISLNCIYFKTHENGHRCPF